MMVFLTFYKARLCKVTFQSRLLCSVLKQKVCMSLQTPETI